MTPPTLQYVGGGAEISIKNLADLISQVSEYKGRIRYDLSMPDGVKQKILDTIPMKKLGWRPNIKLSKGVPQVYQDLVERNG